MTKLKYIFTALGILAATTLMSCSRENPSAHNNLDGTTVAVSFYKSSLAERVARVDLQVTSEDEIVYRDSSEIVDGRFNFESFSVSAGAAYFYISASDDTGAVLYSGDTTASIVPGVNNEIGIELLPAVPMVKLTPFHGTVEVGQHFITTLELFNINRFYNGDFKIAFDQQKIRFTDSVAVADPAWDTLLAIAPVEGDTLILAITRVGMVSDLVPNGVHSLLKLQFEALSPGATELHLVVDIIEDREGAISELPNLYIDDQWLNISGTVDQTPPAKITDLSVVDLSASSVTLNWTATGDDGNVGNLSEQQVAYSTDSLSVANWAGLSPITITDVTEPGSQQTFTVSDLVSGARYFFAVRAGDEADNWSPVSNIVSATPTQVLTVDIPDPVLESLIRVILDQSEGDILASELATITQIIGGGVSDLTGLQYCVNLVHLVLDTSAVSTLVPVIGLNKLERLHITKGLVSDLTPLSNLSNLILLNLSEHSISDIAPLSSLGALERVYLDMNSIVNIGALVNLTNLSRISLQNNQISDIQPLVNNSGIGSGDIIWLNGNPLSATSSRERIPLLEERGVTVHYDTDTTPPAPINDIGVVDNTENSLTFQWTATGDDGNLGTASQYDMRYALNPDTIFAWSNATQIIGEPTPQPSGSIETFTVGGLEPEVTYFFGLLAADEAGNWSALEIVLEVMIPSQSPLVNNNRPGALVRRLNTGDCLTNAEVKRDFIERVN